MVYQAFFIRSNLEESLMVWQSVVKSFSTVLMISSFDVLAAVTAIVLQWRKIRDLVHTSTV